MTKDEICGLLRQIHDVLAMQSETNQVKPVALIDAEIRKAVEAEREACAKVCEETDDGTPYNLAEECARNIRARAVH